MTETSRVLPVSSDPGSRLGVLLKQMILGFSLWGFTVPFTLLAIFYYGQRDEGSNDNGEVESEAQQETDVSSLEAQRISVGVSKSLAI